MREPVPFIRRLVVLCGEIGIYQYTANFRRQAGIGHCQFEIIQLAAFEIPRHLV